MKGAYVWVVAEEHHYPMDEDFLVDVFDTEEDAHNFADGRKTVLRNMFLAKWTIKESRHLFEMRHGAFRFIVRVIKKEIK